MSIPTKGKPARLGDMPTFYNVEVIDLAPDKSGNHFVLAFDQPGAAAREPLQVQVLPCHTCTCKHSPFKLQAAMSAFQAAAHC